jgi:hypothetical protein
MVMLHTNIEPGLPKRGLDRKPASGKMKTPPNVSDFVSLTAGYDGDNRGGGVKPPSGDHPVGRDAERSELKRAFCSSLSEL